MSEYTFGYSYVCTLTMYICIHAHHVCLCLCVCVRTLCSTLLYSGIGKQSLMYYIDNERTLIFNTSPNKIHSAIAHIHLWYFFSLHSCLYRIHVSPFFPLWLEMWITLDKLFLVYFYFKNWVVFKIQWAMMHLKSIHHFTE